MPTPRIWRAGAPLLLLSVMLPARAAESGGAAASEDPTGLAPIDVFALEWASTPRVAPDGKTIAYVRRGFDVMKDRGTSRIWLTNTGGTDGSRNAGRSPSASI